MKKILAITLITLSMLIGVGYSSLVNAQDTQVYFTEDNTPVPANWAWGGTEPNTSIHYEGPSPFTATMTHTYYYGGGLMVDIADDHLIWYNQGGPGDYMINWTNIYAWGAATGTFQLSTTVTGCEHIKGPNGATITTKYAFVPSSGAHPAPGSFTLAPDFTIPSVQGNNGVPVHYNNNLWAEVIPDYDDPTGKYEDVFYLTFAVVTIP